MLREFQAARRVRKNAEAKREEERQLEDCGGGDSRIGRLPTSQLPVAEWWNSASLWGELCSLVFINNCGEQRLQVSAE